MGLGKRHYFMLMFIKSQQASSTYWIVQRRWSFGLLCLKQVVVLKCIPRVCGIIDFVRREKNYFSVRPLFFKFLLLTAATRSPEYLRIRRKFWIWNQSNSQVDSSQCLNVQTVTYLDKWRKDRLTCFCWKRPWNRDCYLYSQVLVPGSHCCFQCSMNAASF